MLNNNNWGTEWKPGEACWPLRAKLVLASVCALLSPLCSQTLSLCCSFLSMLRVCECVRLCLCFCPVLVYAHVCICVSELSRQTGKVQRFEGWCLLFHAYWNLEHTHTHTNAYLCTFPTFGSKDNLLKGWLRTLFSGWELVDNDIKWLKSLIIQYSSLFSAQDHKLTF